MTITKILFVGLIAFSFIFFAQPNNAQSQPMEFGCCQFFVDGEPGCIYPASSEGCSGEGKTYINDGLCDIDTGYCSGYKKDDSKPSDSNKY